MKLDESRRVWDRLRLTDIGNASRFAELNDRDLKYCPTQGWLAWDGTRWRHDQQGQAQERAKALARQMLKDAAEESDDRRSKALAAWASKSASATRVAATLKLAATDPRLVVTHDQLDAHPWLLNCPNGTLDLHTGDLHRHRRDELHTKVTAVPYDPHAQSVLWNRFLRETTGGEEDLLRFLARAAGYSLTGDTCEEAFFFVHGPTAAGKSTFAEAVQAAMGEYARTADFATFLRSRDSDGPRNDLARLAGARLVASIEVDEGRRLAEGLVKSVTGGDTIACRYLYRESFEYRPAFKLWLVANHAPRVSAEDGALWRRMLRIPFEHTVAEADRDPLLKERLCHPQSEDSRAVLAFAVRGCQDYRLNGLQVPESVRAATEAYRRDEDIIGQFIEECCDTEPQYDCLSGDLYRAYRQFAHDAGESRPATQTAFGRALTDLGYKPDKRGGHALRLGIALKQPETGAGA